MTARLCLPAADARRLALGGAALLEACPPRRSAGATLTALLDRLGFVQLDSINVVERAHHHILWSRWDAYRPDMMDRLYDGRLAFEHWTHDASLIPIALFPHWRHRFERYRMPGPWMRERLGPGYQRTISLVLDRIREQGPLMSKDFAEKPGDDTSSNSAGWWNWKPQKAALEYLWRTGELVIAKRVNFHKVYDLTERIHPGIAAEPAPSADASIEWACLSAMERLAIATPRQIAAFYNAVTLSQARAWCDAAARAGRIIPVSVESASAAGNGHAFAVADHGERLARSPEPPARMRFLSPFDPLLRDRQRTLGLFNFDYRFEAFTPAAKRRYGYYTLPVLEGERLIGRIVPELDRAKSTLSVRMFWEPGVKPTRQRAGALRNATAEYAAFNKAATWTIIT